MKISIVIAYNKNRGFLKEAIASARNQTFKDYEIIIYRGDYNFSTNLNNALKKAKGDYIKLLNEDDLLLPNCLEDLYEGIKGYDFVHADSINFGTSEMWFGDKEYHKTIHKGRPLTFDEMKVACHVNQVTVLFRAEAIWDVGGFDESLDTAEDYDMYLALMQKGYKLNYVSKVVGKYRIHETNKSICMDVVAFHDRKIRIRNLIKERYG